MQYKVNDKCILQSSWLTGGLQFVKIISSQRLPCCIAASYTHI